MYDLKIKLTYIVGFMIIFSSTIYGKIATNSSTQETNKSQSSIRSIDNTIKEKQAKLLKIEKTNVTQYMPLSDEIATLILSKNRLLIEMDRTDDVDTDEVCNYILDYAEVEFVKTQYYKTPFHDSVADTLQTIASLYELCHPPMAEKYLKSILKIKENIYTKESVEAAQALDALGDHARFSMANFSKAVMYYEEAKGIREKLYGASDSRITENYARLAVSMFYFGDKANRAEKLLLQSIDLREKLPAHKEMSVDDAYMDIGIYYSMKDEYDKSIVYLKKALKLSNSGTNSKSIIVLDELSRVYLNNNDLQNSLIYAKEAYEKTNEWYGDNQHPRVLESLRRVTEITDMMKK